MVVAVAREVYDEIGHGCCNQLKWLLWEWDSVEKYRREVISLPCAVIHSARGKSSSAYASDIAWERSHVDM